MTSKTFHYIAYLPQCGQMSYSLELEARFDKKSTRCKFFIEKVCTFGSYLFIYFRLFAPGYAYENRVNKEQQKFFQIPAPLSC